MVTGPVAALQDKKPIASVRHVPVAVVPMSKVMAAWFSLLHAYEAKVTFTAGRPQRGAARPNAGPSFLVSVLIA
jgi:hypothetical protein